MAGPLTAQAQNEALVRYGPQRFALRELLQQALTTRDMHLRAAAGAERGIQAAIAAARGQTARTYADAAQTTTGTRGLVDEALAKLGPGASPFAAAIARERGGATDRLTEGQANTLQDLTQRRLEAASGRAYETQAATQQFGQDVGKVQRSYQELAAEQGAFTQGRVGELKKEQADRQFQRDLAEFTQSEQDKRARGQQRTTRRGQDLSHADRQAAIEQRRAAARNKKKTAANRPRTGVGSLTQGEENSIKDDINSVVSVITNPPAFEDPPKGAKPGAKGPRLTHQRMLQHLRTGTNPLGKPIPADIIEIAYQLRDNNGVLSPTGVKLLHSRGMHVPKEWLPKKPRTGGGAYGLNTPAPR
jgi:hypothetical protein